MSSLRIKPASGFELWWWYFMRVSGLVLVVLALGHLCITHLINNVEVINYAFVAERWDNPRTGVIWRLWDLTMINLAVLHGFNGLRQILHEWVVRPGARKLVGTLIWSSCVALIGIGSYAILNFQRDEEYLRRFREANPPVAAAESGVVLSPTPAPPALATTR
jgi:succinate dehydrogenase / fumarate reductase membrane anchor subunit